MQVNSRPSYFVILERKGPIEAIFRVYEQRDGEIELMFKMSNRGDRLNKLLKRGIPLDDAKGLFYAMDT